MKRNVYLAGPITGLSYGGATEWRQYVADRLPEYILPVSPMRGKQYLGKEEKIGLLKPQRENPTFAKQKLP